MKLTLDTAIAECQKLWREIKASGLSKADFLNTPAGRLWVRKYYMANCPLCEYDTRCKDWDCRCCPLPGEGCERCRKLGYSEHEIPTQGWFDVIENLGSRRIDG